MTAPAPRKFGFPLPVFNFVITFTELSLARPANGGRAVDLCGGAFSECTGLEATMEPKVIKEGGHNYGAIQRAGPVTFATVVLKRGVTKQRDLWRWFELTTNGTAFAHRMRATIEMKDAAGTPIISWQLDNALPVKFKASDLNAKGTEVGVEELHIAHEGLTLLEPGAGGASAGGGSAAGRTR